MRDNAYPPCRLYQHVSIETIFRVSQHFQPIPWLPSKLFMSLFCINYGSIFFFFFVDSYRKKHLCIILNLVEISFNRNRKSWKIDSHLVELYLLKGNEARIHANINKGVVCVFLKILLHKSKVSQTTSSDFL